MKNKSIKYAWEKKFQKKIKQQKINPLLRINLNKFLNLLKKNSKILDLGCGEGDKTTYIACKGFKVVGVDSSKTAVKNAKKNFKNIIFLVRDVTNTRLPSKSFDAITSVAVHHVLLEKDRKLYIKEVRRLLKKGGLLFQLVLSSDDETMKQGKEIEKNTFLQKSGVAFHLFTEKELREDFKDFKILHLKHHKKNIIKAGEKLSIACYITISENK